MHFGIIEVALLLGVNVETVRRWIRAEGEKGFSVAQKGTRGRNGIRMSYAEVKKLISEKMDKKDGKKITPHFLGAISILQMISQTACLLQDVSSLKTKQKIKPEEVNKILEQKKELEEIKSRIEDEIKQREEELNNYKNDIRKLAEKLNMLEHLISECNVKDNSIDGAQTIGGKKTISKVDKENTAFERKQQKTSRNDHSSPWYESKGVLNINYKNKTKENTEE